MDQKEYFALLARDPENFEELDSCPWCNCKNFTHWGRQSYDGFLTVLCDDCRVVYVRRRFNALGRKRLCDGYLDVRQEKKRAQKRELAHDLELSFIYRYVESGRICDVGCGGGYLLERMPADKWEKWGTELGSSAVERAKKVLGTDRIFEGEIQDINLPRNYFDLIIARGVIEHVPWPRRFLNSIAVLVRRGGFVFMSGPNLASFCAQFYKDRWNLHYPEAHLFHFSVEHFSDALAQHGFGLVADVYHYLETPYASPMEDILKISNDIISVKKGKSESLSAQSPPFFGNRYTAIWKKI